MGLYSSRSADSFLRTQINPYNPTASIPKSPTIDDFQELQDKIDNDKLFHAETINNDAIDDFLNVFKKV